MRPWPMMRMMTRMMIDLQACIEKAASIESGQLARKWVDLKLCHAVMSPHPEKVVGAELDAEYKIAGQSINPRIVQECFSVKAGESLAGPYPQVAVRTFLECENVVSW